MTTKATSTAQGPKAEMTATRARRWPGGDRGAALVEFAIIAPLVFALLLGLFSGGIALSQRNSMTNAVREGARLGATLTHDGTWGDTVEDRVLELASGDLTASQICVKLVQAPNTDIQSDSTCAGALAADEPAITGVTTGDCVVLVWSERTGKLEVVFWSQDLDMATHSVSTYERECP
jgi:Flp pilus assembly protein TadG